MPKNTFKRYEKKYRITNSQLEMLLPEILKYMNYDDYCTDGREYGVYNIYYDTEDNYLIRESLQKPSYKEKIRLRTYFSPCGDEDTCFLELKKKAYGVVFKRRITLSLAQAENFIERGIVPQFPEDDYINNQVTAELNQFLRMYRVVPRQYISYNRYAFFGKEDSDFRLTFDRDITARTDNLTLRSTPCGEKLIADDERLMEIKISGTMPMWLSHALSDAKIFSTSFSKYGTAYGERVKSDLCCANPVENEELRHAV